MRRLHFPSLVLLAAFSLLGGCSAFQSPKLYTLDSGNPEIPERNGVAVLLDPVELADYLKRDTALVQRNADGSLSTVRHAEWAGDLQGNIDQLLLRQLAWHLGSQRLALEPAQGFKPDVTVEVSVSRLDSGPEQPVVLEAQWRLLDRQGQLSDSRLVQLQEIHTGTIADQVRAQSAVLQRLADQMAQAIRPLAQRPASQASRKTAQRSRPKVVMPQPAEPAIPMATPTRNVEVYRF